MSEGEAEMSRIKVEDLGEGQHPSERMVAVMTAEGVRETVIVDRESIQNMTIDVGYPVGGGEDRLLVELPRETTSGRWRLWVKRSDVLAGMPA